MVDISVFMTVQLSLDETNMKVVLFIGDRVGCEGRNTGGDHHDKVKIVF